MQKVPQPQPPIRKKLTISELRRYLPMQHPSFPQSLPLAPTTYLLSSRFSNLSLIEQKTTKQKYGKVYRNYFTVQEIVDYLDKLTFQRYQKASIRKTILECSQRNGLIDWYKFLRVAMKGKIQPLRVQDIQKKDLAQKIKKVFLEFMQKRNERRGIQEVSQSMKTLDDKIMNQLSKQVLNEVKEFVERNRHQCDQILYQCEKKYKKNITFVELQRILNKQLEMYIDRKKVVYFYLYFDRVNKGYFALANLLSQILVVKRQKAVERKTYYLVDLEEVFERIREDMKASFYSSHDLQNEFAEYYELKAKQKGLQLQMDEELDEDIFYHFVNEKCEGKYSRYMINRVHKNILFKSHIHYLFNKPNVVDLAKIVDNLIVKHKKKRVLKKENPIFYQYRTIILNLIARCKSSKLTRQKLAEFCADFDTNVVFKSFYCVWRVYPNLINVERIKRETKLNALACHLKLKRTQQEYEKMYEDLLELYPSQETVAYGQIEDKINSTLDYVLETTKIKPLDYQKDQQVNYRKAIQQIFQPDFEIYLRSYIHRKVAQKTYALWKGYKARKQAERRIEFARRITNLSNLSSPNKTPEQRSSGRMKSQRSKASLKSTSTKKQPLYNPETIEIVKWNLQKLLNELILTQKSKLRQYHKSEHKRQYLCVKRKQLYEYRTLTPRYCLHWIAGVIGMGSDVMFLNKNKLEKIKIKFFYKPGIEVIDFNVVGNSIIILTSYFTLEFYSLSQDSNYSYQTTQLLDSIDQVGFGDLDSYCQDRMYSRFPIFIRTSGNLVIVNTALINNQIIAVNSESNLIELRVQFTQRQHVFNTSTRKILSFMSDSPRKLQLAMQILTEMGKDQPSSDTIKQILNFQLGELELQGENVQRFSDPEVKSFIKNLSAFSAPLAICILKQQLNMIKELKIPASLTEVLNSLMEHMISNNISFATVFAAIDRNNEGFIRMKSLKDYLLKITQQVFSANQKQIDEYLRSSSGKNIEYENFCEIMKSWKYKIWERPRLVIRDFLFVADSNILIYTIEQDENVYIKNMRDNLIIAVLCGHSCAPSIYFVDEGYLLITGDQHTIRVWRIYEDFIRKYDENPPWQIQPYSITPKAHDAMITSILYLNRAHHLVTTSLDSTTKFWQIQAVPGSIDLQEVKRFYSNECVYLSSKSSCIALDGQGCKLQILALAKVSKQINENNKYKYEMKLEVFEVENTVVKTGQQNIHLQLPPKLKTTLESYVDSLGVKKRLLLGKTISQFQNQTMKNNLISDNIERTLYESVKMLYIFGEARPLRNIVQYMQRKKIESQILRVLFTKFGVGIPKPNKFSAIKHESMNIEVEEQNEQEEQFINISQDEIEGLKTKLKQRSTGKTLKIIDALTIAQNFLNVVNFEKLQTIISSSLQKSQNQNSEIDIIKFLTLFKPLKLNSEFERFCAILRSVNILMRNEGYQIWNIFASNKSDLEKKRTVLERQFETFLLKLGISQSKIDLIISYLSKSKNVHIDDLIYYTKLAWEAIGFDIKNSNFSNIFMKNSHLLQSKFEAFQLDSQIMGEINEKMPIEQKLKSLQDSLGESNIRQTLGSRKSSRKHLKQAEMISESNSQQKSIKKKKSLEISHKQQGGKSMPLSSSNSRASLSHQSNSKGLAFSEIKTIVRKIKEMLKNEGKNLWDIISITVPQFMQNKAISQTQYFNTLSAIKSPVYLKDKLKLMNYIMSESSKCNGIDINMLFELFQSPAQQANSKTAVFVPGEKHIIAQFVSKLSDYSFIFEHSLNQFIFKDREELTIDQILGCLSGEPFDMLQFCVKQFQSLLHLQNKSAFTLEELRQLVEERIAKWNIKIESKEINFIEEIIHRIQNKGAKVQDLMLKSMANNGVVNYRTFYNMITSFFQQKEIIIQNEFIKIYLSVLEERKLQKDKEKQSPSKFSKKLSPKKVTKPKKQLTHDEMLTQAEIKYKQLIGYIMSMIQKVKKSTSSQKDGVKKFLKALESKKLNLLSFFVSLDRNRNYFINEVQFTAGLTELKVHENFWSSINKKDNRRLNYWEFVHYLVEHQFVNYKCVDSELEEAMLKFVKRFMRNDDLEAVFDRLRAKESNQPFNVTYKSFESALKMCNLFKDHEIFYIFGAFANADHLKNSSFSNDAIIKDETNVHKVFNFKMFADVVSTYKNENITKSPHYKLCYFLKRRNISLLNEFTKWMQRNKKIKQVSEAIKMKVFTLPKQLYINLIKQLGTELTDKEVKQLLSQFPNLLQFSVFNQKIQQMYKKGNSNIETEEIVGYLHQIRKIQKKANVSIERLFQDFSSDRYKMKMVDFTQLLKFLQVGLTKIQNKMIFEYVDLQKKGFITLNEFSNALDDAGQSMEKEEDEYELDYIIEKLLANKSKYVLKPSRISFNVERSFTIFSNVLTKEDNLMLFKNAQQHHKMAEITEKNMEQYILHKQKEIRAKKDKKYKQLIINFINFLKRTNLDVSQCYTYLTRDVGVLAKNRFIISYQSFGLKASILEINTLYSYLDEGRIGSVSKQKWEDRLNLIEYEKQNENVPGEELQVFYKVKLILADIYLVFVHKLYRSKQISAYFDIHGDGRISHKQFRNSLAQLGMDLQDTIYMKLLNYLDKQRSGEIQVGVLVNELENCLNSKTKLILQTKTSCIFKEKIYLIQEKQFYFIERLVELQHFIEGSDKLQSCILMTDFIHLISDFGIVLGEDELNDVERNFKYNKDNLQLYPLYLMFTNIFQTYQNALSNDQMERLRFQKLFKTLVSSNLTLRIFEQLKNRVEVNTFLSQLKIFTPIEIKLLIQSITLSGTDLIDIQKLIDKTRNSFLTNSSFNSNVSNYLNESDRTTLLKQWLKAQLDKEKIVDYLRANSGRIDIDIFRNLLVKNQIVLREVDVKEIFRAFAKGQEFVLIEELIMKDSEDKIGEEEGQKNNDEREGEKFKSLLLNHICKSLDLKGVSLEQAWQKYFVNFGFISQQSFKAFLSQIGFDYTTQQYSKQNQPSNTQFHQHFELTNFITCYFSQNPNSEFKTTQFQLYMKKHGESPRKICHKDKYFIQSNVIRNIIEVLGKVDEGELEREIEEYLVREGGNLKRVSPGMLMRALWSRIGHCGGEKQIIFWLGLLIRSSETEFNVFHNRLKSFILAFRQSQNHQNPFTPLAQGILNSPSHSVLAKISESNFVWSYKSTIKYFDKKISLLEVPKTNLQRLGLNLIVQKLVQSDYLLYCKGVFGGEGQSGFKEASMVRKKNGSVEGSVRFNMKLVNNFIVESEQYIPSKGVYLLNSSYHSLPISSKIAFETFAEVSSLLDNSLTFLHSKNYFLWQPNSNILPKNAFNYRWKYVLPVLYKIAKQILMVENYGYMLPHLRWGDLNKVKGVGLVREPAKATCNRQGLSISNNFSLQDSYCAPQLFRSSYPISPKIDSWILGCIIYEFIWGHEPNSFILQLLDYLERRDCQYNIGEVLEMQELPNTFVYRGINYRRVWESVSKQFGLKGAREGLNTVPENIEEICEIEGIRGLMKYVQMLYGSECMYFRQQFKLLGELHTIIEDCLCPDPRGRIQVEDIVQRLKLLMQEQDYHGFDEEQYINVLDNHQDTCEVNKLINKLEFDYSGGNTTNLEQLSAEICRFIEDSVARKRVRDIYSVPKMYPWPQQEMEVNQSFGGTSSVGRRVNSHINALSEGSSMNLNDKLGQTYSRTYSHTNRILENKQQIRSHGGFTTLCTLLNSRCLQKLIHLFGKFMGKQSKNLGEKVQANVFRIIKILFNGLEDYCNPAVGYVDQIIQLFVQFYYVLPQRFSCYSGAFRGLGISCGSSFIHKQALDFIKGFIYLDGRGNPIYSALFNYLQCNQKHRLLFEYFYVSLDLQSSEAKGVLALNYYQDRILEDQFWDIIRYLRIDVLIWRLGQKRQMWEVILQFFREITCYSDYQSFTLLHSNMFYLKMGDILTVPLIETKYKIKIIRILTNIINYRNLPICRKMNEPSFPLLREILKLLIEPPRDSALHWQYEQMKDVLREFLNALKGVDSVYERVRMVGGADNIIRNFEQKWGNYLD